MSKKTTKEVQSKILDMRDAGYTYRQIQSEVGCSSATIYKILKEREGQKVCPKCGEILPHNAKFCFVCGTKILTKREWAAEDLAHIADLYKFLPETARDEFIRAIRAAISMLKEEPHE